MSAVPVESGEPEERESLEVEPSLRQLTVTSTKDSKYLVNLARFQSKAHDIAHAIADPVSRGRTITDCAFTNHYRLPGTFYLSPEALGSIEAVNKEHAVDCMIENQRGWFLMGYPFFSDNSLLPLDPTRWTNTKGRPLPGGPATCSLPDMTWEWVWKRWYVDMSGDVDDQGWRYSWRFGSGTWHATHVFFRSFVRKRIWKRLRQKLDEKRPENKDIKGYSHELPAICEEDDAQKIENLVAELKSARIDRERIEKIIRFVEDYDNIHALSVMQLRVGEIFASFEFLDSQRHLFRRLGTLISAGPEDSRHIYGDRRVTGPTHLVELKRLIDGFHDQSRESEYFSERTEHRDPTTNRKWKGKQKAPI
jgi:hypothetical protein